MSSSSATVASTSSDSTWSASSWSSVSEVSANSTSSESSSWSSETSAWDTGSAQAESYLVHWSIQVRHGVFVATCSLDLRWRDAVIVQARGPLFFDVGGTFGDDVYPEEIVDWIDGLTVTKSWTTLDNATAWVQAVEGRAQAAMAVLRQLYQQYPTYFDQRTRTI